VYEFRLPDLGEGIHEAEILEWCVQEGDQIGEDEPLIKVETDKAAVTIPSPKAGRVLSLKGAVGEILSVGDVIVSLETGALEPPQLNSAPQTLQKSASMKSPQTQEASVPGPPSQTRGPVPAAPATRRLAREMGIDLREVQGTGPAGRVIPEDLRAFKAVQGAPAPEASPTPPEPKSTAVTESSPSAIPFYQLPELPDFGRWGVIEEEPLRSIRRKVAYRMVSTRLIVPHVVHMDEADVSLLEALRRRERSRQQESSTEKLTLLAFLIKALAAGLKEHPSFNASIDPIRERIIYKRYIHIGIAVDTPKGLLVPVIRDVDQKSVLQISQEIAALARRGREGKLALSELQGGSFTVTNVGPLGGTHLIPVINYPEVAILGMGRSQERPVVRDGEILIREILPLSFAFDHRIADGAEAARFITTLCQRLSEPDRFLLET